jgi:FkbM family methyltransferase
MELLNTNINLIPQQYQCLENKNKFLDYIEIGTCFWDSWCHEKPNLKGIVIEPIKFYLDKLLSDPRCLKKNLIVENLAVSNFNGESKIFFIPPQIIDRNPHLSDCLKGMNKLGEPHIGHRPDDRKKFIQEIPCNVTTLLDLIKKHSVKYFDHLKIDTEGHDCVILNNMIDTYQDNFILPRFVLFENNSCTKKNVITNTINKLYNQGYQHIFTKDDNTYMYNTRTYFELSKLQYNINQNKDVNICKKKIFVHQVHMHYVEVAFKELFRKYNFNLVENPESADIIITTQDINDIKNFKNKFPNKIIVSQLHGGGVGQINLLQRHYPNIPIICKSFHDFHFFSKHNHKVVLSIGKYEKVSNFFRKIYAHRLENLDLTNNNFLNLCSSLKWNPPAIRNCYFNLRDKWNIDTFGPDSPQGFRETICDNFIDSPFTQYKFYLHLKNIGYLCNSVVQAMMSGIPIIMSRQNYIETLYVQFVPKEIIIFIENHNASLMTEQQVITAIQKAISLSKQEYLELSHKTFLAGAFFRHYYKNEFEEMNAFLNNL